MDIYWKFLGRTDFSQCFELQERIREAVLNDESEDHLLLTEHNRVFTLGRRENGSNLLASKEFLKAKGFDVVKTTRGGMVTYHGPGQLVIYPILNLRRHGLKLKKYVEKLELCVVDLLDGFGIKASRKEGYPGVWIADKKIGSLGIHVKRSVTMHGFALNIFTDLNDFNFINPCGFEELSITSLEREGVKLNSLKPVYEKLVSSFEKIFNVNCVVAKEKYLSYGK